MYEYVKIQRKTTLRGYVSNDFYWLNATSSVKYFTFTYNIRVLQFDKLHDSVCEGNSRIDRKFWQHFYETFSFHVFKGFLPFLFLSDRLLHLWEMAWI